MAMACFFAQDKACMGARLPVARVLLTMTCVLVLSFVASCLVVRILPPTVATGGESLLVGLTYCSSQPTNPRTPTHMLSLSHPASHPAGQPNAHTHARTRTRMRTRRFSRNHGHGRRHGGRRPKTGVHPQQLCTYKRHPQDARSAALPIAAVMGSLCFYIVASCLISPYNTCRSTARGYCIVQY
ncbi:uncharacterized protein K452DRAFT_163505 [Aplosporella prunicola CBS 121167]|uniref:Uncharacterized protein n=1 Tax=Aplosporella prunicola CBS 121167 TaxID=1176127 RepID=A0A6A6BI80_9PEZI|nr:uncharacterized protein K452DRAFT_163505 [Aplosporella prunicola CBS 121167]KAF2143859.1 hypothetical protein K452DRAFT_163505 [Aplosporella prunicola CBS 121167]